MRRSRLFPCILVFAALSARAETVLVLPFFNRSHSANIDWIGESIAENVRESLSSEGVLVLDREDRLEAYRRLSLRPGAMLTHASVIKVGQALDASKVVYGQYDLTPPPAEGTAQGAPVSRGSLRITARIMDLDRLKQGPEYAEIGALEDLTSLENRLGWQTLRFVLPKVAPTEQEFLAARPPVRVDAVENYVRGLRATSVDQKHRFFTQAARLDERFSQPCFQLGKIYWEKPDYRVAAGWLARVKRNDSHYLEAQFFMGLCRYYNGDFLLASQAFQTVGVWVPVNEVWNDLGAALSRLGLPTAAQNFTKALEGDSADPDYHFNLGYVLWKSGRFDAAADSFRAVLERSPADTEATSFLGRALKKDGPHPGDARTEGRERIKTNYEETAYRQLKAALENKK